MKVKMIAEIRGTRDGEDWPARGAIAEFPEDEAADLIMNGYAIDPADVEDSADEPDEETADEPDEETADEPDGDVETATPRRGRKA
jgi:hypothetical protein